MPSANPKWPSVAFSNCSSIAEEPVPIGTGDLAAGQSDLFPEISGSLHRCTIRFLNWTDATSRPVHVEMDVPFLLTCCS